jgi:hypothetical protein
MEGNLRLREGPRPELALLPNLTHLDVSPAHPEDFRVLLCLLASGLVSLKVTFIHIDELDNDGTAFPQSSDYIRLAEEIISISPNLNDLDLFCHYDTVDPLFFAFLGHEVFTSLLEFQSGIRRLGMALGIFGQLLCNPLPSMSQLTELDLRGDDFSSMSGTPAMLQLPALRKLSGNLPSGSEQLWVPLISAVGGTIEEIGFNTHEDANDCERLDPVGLVEVIVAIGASCPSLRLLRIYWDLEEGDTFPTGSLRPMLNCTKITELRIESFEADFDFSLRLSDDDVKSMALAWPNIEVLLLGHEYTYKTDVTESTPTLSPSALQALCSQCSRLRSVALTVDLTVVPATPIRPSGTHAAPLESLHFCGSTIKDPYAVAKWIGSACVANGIRSAKGMRCGCREDTLWVQVRNIVALL